MGVGHLIRMRENRRFPEPNGTKRLDLLEQIATAIVISENCPNLRYNSKGATQIMRKARIDPNSNETASKLNGRLFAARIVWRSANKSCPRKLDPVQELLLHKT